MRFYISSKQWPRLSHTSETVTSSCNQPKCWKLSPEEENTNIYIYISPLGRCLKSVFSTTLKTGTPPMPQWLSIHSLSWFHACLWLTVFCWSSVMEGASGVLSHDALWPPCAHAPASICSSGQPVWLIQITREMMMTASPYYSSRKVALNLILGKLHTYIHRSVPVHLIRFILTILYLCCLMICQG